MTNFADLGLSEAALSAVTTLGYDAPTPVQEQAIPLVLQGRDLIAAASTGTGKTAAFLLPTLSTLPRAKTRKRAPRVLVVSPTRELAQQIARTCMQIARKTNHYVTTVFGGTPYGPQIKEIRGGTDVLIATPGRLNDLMDRGIVDLSGIEVLVLDEADRMLDMGFLPAVTAIVEQTPDNRQTLLFSATIDRTIQKNLGTLLNNPAIVEIAHKGETAKTVAQYMMPIAHRSKPELLRAVLEEKGSDRVIVFARTKNRTEECAEALRHEGFSAESIHSDKSQGQRRKALDNFRRGKTSILVATDVLARGIDVPDVDHVINFDLPDMPEDYVHRIGRTGRAGEQGYAISFVSRETRRTLKDIERLIDKEIPMMELETYELDASLLTKPGKTGGRSGNGGKRYDKNRSGGNRNYAKNGSYAKGSSRPEGKRAEGARKEGSRPTSKFASSNGDSRGTGKRTYQSDNRPGRSSRPAEGRRSEGKTTSPNFRNAEKRAGTNAARTEKPRKQRSRSTNEGGYDFSRFAKKERVSDEA